MNHADAVKRQAAEKYLLGELPDQDAEDFERHYFACEECTTEVEAGAVFVDNACAVLRERPRRAESKTASREAGFGAWISRALADFRHRPMRAIPALAAVLFAVVSSYQGLVVIPNLKRGGEESSAARSLTIVNLRTVRGSGDTVSVPRGAMFFAVSVDPNWETAFPEYRCELRDASGARRFSVGVPAPAPGIPLSILIPTRDLNPGEYSLAVSGTSPDVREPRSLASYSFTLQNK